MGRIGPAVAAAASYRLARMDPEGTGVRPAILDSCTTHPHSRVKAEVRSGRRRVALDTGTAAVAVAALPMVPIACGAVQGALAPARQLRHPAGYRSMAATAAPPASTVPPGRRVPSLAAVVVVPNPLAELNPALAEMAASMSMSFRLLKD